MDSKSWLGWFQPALCSDGPRQCFLPCLHLEKLHSTDNTTKTWLPQDFFLLLSFNQLILIAFIEYPERNEFWAMCIGDHWDIKNTDLEIRPTKCKSLLCQYQLHELEQITYSFTSKMRRQFLCFVIIMRIKWDTISPSLVSANLTNT